MRILEKINFLILLVISISFQAEAQFIKNLNQAVYQGMENTVEKKVEQEVEKMIIRNQLKSS
ncbi:MAG: hypothetical protein ACI9UV_001204 [Algoriphagus sp.]|jgi:hypothetical protein